MQTNKTQNELVVKLLLFRHETARNLPECRRHEKNCLNFFIFIAREDIRKMRNFYTFRRKLENANLKKTYYVVNDIIFTINF